jgi:hypothetical protein
MATGALRGTIDGVGKEAYNSPVMKLVASIRFMLSIILISLAFPVLADDPDADLNAALEAHKKTPKRRAYSNKALIEDRDLLIPKTRSEEEKALDQKLKKLENRLNSQPAPMLHAPAPRRTVPVPVQKRNWLAPEVLDPKNTADRSSEEDAANWITLELERQQAIQLQKKTLAEEEALVNKLRQGGSRKRYSTESTSSNPYESILQNMAPQPTLQYEVIDPLSSLRAKEEKAKKATLFSPASRAASGVIKPSFSSRPSTAPRTPSWYSQPASPAAGTRSNLKPSWNDTTPTPLTPLKRVRKASSIHRKDPFSDDLMPGIKTSIWD